MVEGNIGYLIQRVGVVFDCQPQEGTMVSVLGAGQDGGITSFSMPQPRV